MRVLVAMSGGVDSSVAAAVLRDEGHDVVGVTMKLWGGDSDTGCCSVSDVDDARRVARALGIEHHVFNFGDDFGRHVVDPYVHAHASGSTPNPCIECNRHIKFDKLIRRSVALGFDAIATGHHARVVTHADGSRRVARGVDRAKDQSYVLAMLGPRQLERTLLPIGDRTKHDVRVIAASLALPTATKPDSQDVCFITSGAGRRAFLGERIPFTPAQVVDRDGRAVGSVDAVELVTIGQRRGLGVSGGDGSPRYVVDVDRATATIVVGSEDDLLVDATPLRGLTFAGPVRDGDVTAQCSAHGAADAAVLDGDVLRWARPHRRVAPGQTVAIYDGDEVIASAIAGPDPGN